MININDYKYLNNISDILSFFEDKTFLDFYNSINDDNIKVTSNLIHNKKYISRKEQFIFNLDNYISFIKNNIFINPLELRYIISLTLNNKYNKILYSDTYYYDDTDTYIREFINMFMFNYNKNISFLKKYINIKKLNFEELSNFINKHKKRTYCLFETINQNNMNFYIPIINSLFN